LLKVVIFNRANFPPLFFGCGSYRLQASRRMWRGVCACVRTCTRACARVCARVRTCLPTVVCSKIRYFQPSLFLVLLWVAAAAGCKPEGGEGRRSEGRAAACEGIQTAAKERPRRWRCGEDGRGGKGNLRLPKTDEIRVCWSLVLVLAGRRGVVVAGTKVCRMAQILWAVVVKMVSCSGVGS
jgi:hypothetical protein